MVPKWLISTVTSPAFKGLKNPEYRTAKPRRLDNEEGRVKAGKESIAT
jgi:hypothetical protein